MNQNLKWDTSILEKAQIIAEREKMLISNGQRKGASDNQYTPSDKYSTADLAAEASLSHRIYQRYKQVSEIDHTAIEIIKKTAVANNLDALLSISRESDDIQIEVARRITNNECSVPELIRDVKAGKTTSTKGLSLYILKVNDGSDGQENTYKIGISKNLDGRMKDIQAMNANEIELVFEQRSIHYFKIEKMCHEYFKDFKIRGEWFSIEVKVMNEFLDHLKGELENGEELFDIISKVV